MRNDISFYSLMDEQIFFDKDKDKKINKRVNKKADKLIYKINRQIR